MATDLTLHAASLLDVPQIKDLLRRSHDEATSSTNAGPCVATLNLIVYVDDPEYREWVLERSGRFAEKHPSRLLVLDATRTDGGADVATSGGGNGACTVLNQRVDLSVGGTDPHALASVVSELIVADTHTVVWWSSARVHDMPVLEALLPITATIVVDSSGPRRSDDAVTDVAAFLTQHHGVVVRDLAYMRLLPWQDMIAQFFDHQDLFGDLFSLRRLEITAGSTAEMMYLAGWLGSRLSWSVRDRHTFVARDGAPVPLIATRQGEPRRVRRVALGTDESTYVATLTDDDTVVCLSIEGTNEKPCWYTPLQHIDNMSLVERATLERGPDGIFESTVEAVCELLQCTAA